MLKYNQYVAEDKSIHLVPHPTDKHVWTDKTDHDSNKAYAVLGTRHPDKAAVTKSEPEMRKQHISIGKSKGYTVHFHDSE